MDGRLNITPCKKTQGITRIHRQTPIKRLSPLPVTSLVILDLKTSYRLTEEKRVRAKISMASGPKTVFELFNLFGGEFPVFHVAKMGFVVSSPFVQVDKVVFWDLEGEGCEVVERVEDFFVKVLVSKSVKL